MQVLRPHLRPIKSEPPDRRSGNLPFKTSFSNDFDDSQVWGNTDFLPRFIMKDIIPFRDTGQQVPRTDTGAVLGAGGVAQRGPSWGGMLHPSEGRAPEHQALDFMPGLWPVLGEGWREATEPPGTLT